MANHVGIEFAAKTDAGLVRPKNEDSIALSPAYGIAVLADGMGGYNAGEVASSIATTVIKDVVEEGLNRLPNQSFDLLSSRSKQIQQLLIEAIQRANTAILEAAQAEPRYNGMGTTLVTAVFQQDKIIVAHVGDSRAYRFRRGQLTQITRDHSLLQEQIDAGLISLEAAQFSQYRNLVTRAVGVDHRVDVEVHEHRIEPGDVYLLCSDGLSDMLVDREILDTFHATGSALDKACDALVNQANERGGRDNISVVLTKIHSDTHESTGLLGRIRNWMS